MDEEKDQKTEDPTDKKRDDSFKKGKTAKSKEVSATVVLMATIWALNTFGTDIREDLSEVLTSSFTTFFNIELTIDSLQGLMIYYGKLMALTLAPLMLAATISGLLINVAQNGGLILTGEPMMPKMSKLNPLKGFGRFFSKQAAMELIKSLVKIAIVSTVCWMVISDEWESLPGLSTQSIEQILLFVSRTSLKLMFYVLLVTIFLAAIDFAFEKYTFEDGLKMSKQEIKDERKSSEGDPQVKARIRSVQTQMARKRMMSDVPSAEVIITNPTHLAIALAYDKESMGAPKVVAKGAGVIAKRIRELAEENDIPIIEDKPLARIMFKSVGIGDFVPEELYKAIAEILAYVYRLKSKTIWNR